MNSVEKFEQWCVVEIMGHKRFAGLVTEQSVGGTSFVRIDIPEVTTTGGQKLPAFTKLFGAASIYCLSPCTEETARAFAASIRAEGFALYEAPRLPAPVPVVEEEWEGDPVDMTDAPWPRDEDPEAATPKNQCQAELDEFAKALGVETEVLTDEDVDILLGVEKKEFRIPAHPIEDAGFVDPIDNEPF